jgi:large subunit ribosomal protein L24
MTQINYKIKKDDTVIVIAGNFKGNIGKVTRVDKKTARIYISGIKPLTKFKKKNLSFGITTGSQVEVPRSVHISNVMIYLENSKTATKIEYQTDSTGKKIRIAKKTKEPLTANKVSDSDLKTPALEVPKAKKTKKEKPEA